MLLKWGLEKARQEGKNCYLFATSAGRPLYEAAGFIVREEYQLFGVPHYAMLLSKTGSTSHTQKGREEEN